MQACEHVRTTRVQGLRIGESRNICWYDLRTGFALSNRVQPVCESERYLLPSRRTIPVPNYSFVSCIMTCFMMNLHRRIARTRATAAMNRFEAERQLPRRWTQLAPRRAQKARASGSEPVPPTLP